MTDESPMPFGKHKGEKLANVPGHYLLWLYRVSYNNQCLPGDSELNKYIHENLDVLREETTPPPGNG